MRRTWPILRSSRGLTLAELMVAAAIALVVLVVASEIYGRVMRLSARDAALAEMQESGSLAMERLVDDLSHCSAASVSPGPLRSSGVDCLVLQPIDRVAVDSRLLFASQLIGYAWDAQNKLLLRREWSEQLADPRAPLVLAPDRAAELASGAGPRVLARGVEEFRLETDALGHLSRPLTIHLRLRRDVPYGQRTQEFELQRAYVWEN